MQTIEIEIKESDSFTQTREHSYTRVAFRQLHLEKKDSDDSV